MRSDVNGRRGDADAGDGGAERRRQGRAAEVNWQILDAAGKTVATAEAPAQQIDAQMGAATFTATAKLANPALWSVETPNLYPAVVTVESGGKTRDAERVSFGVRTAKFDADKGFLLNGKPVKIQGTCNHQDHAGVGAALPDACSGSGWRC